MGDTTLDTKSIDSKTLENKEAVTNYYCGVTFELGGKEISLNPSTAINEIKTKGIECSLPERVDFGRVKDVFDNITKTLGAETYTWEHISDEIKDVPILSSVTDLLGEANLAVEQFHLKTAPTYVQPPTEPGHEKPPLRLIPTEDRLPTRYTVALSMNWQGDSGTLFGDLKLKGIVFKVSNEE